MDARVDKGRRRRRWAGGALVLLVWWGALGGLWMLLVDTVSVAEVSCAAVAALLGALASHLAFEQQIAPLRLTARMLVWLGRQLARVPADLWLLAVVLGRALLGRHRPGRFHEIAVQLPEDPAGNTRRAGIELFGSLAPNTIVLGVDGRRAIVHQLAARHQERDQLREMGS
jgi:multisubunit Na+/H+ antiporter MnhE subunit